MTYIRATATAAAFSYELYSRSVPETCKVMGSTSATPHSPIFRKVIPPLWELAFSKSSSWSVMAKDESRDGERGENPPRDRVPSQHPLSDQIWKPEALTLPS